MKPIRHKFGNVITERGGLKFRSKKEAKFYDLLKIAQKGGHVLFFHRQPKFDLPGGVSYSADFQVFYADGTVRYYDVKGFKTKGYKRNKKMVEALYPVVIEER